MPGLNVNNDDDFNSILLCVSKSEELLILLISSLQQGSFLIDSSFVSLAGILQQQDEDLLIPQRLTVTA